MQIESSSTSLGRGYLHRQRGKTTAPFGRAAVSYELAVALRQRVWDESRVELQISLEPDGTPVRDGFGADSLGANPEQEDVRVPMTYKGVLAVPGKHPTRGNVWYVRFPGAPFESVCGSSVEEVVDLVYDRPDLLPFRRQGSGTSRRSSNSTSSTPGAFEAR